MNETYATYSAVGGIVLTLIVFLLARELVCWYFKINEAVKLLKSRDEQDSKILHTLIEIRDNLKK